MDLDIYAHYKNDYHIFMFPRRWRFEASFSVL